MRKFQSASLFLMFPKWLVALGLLVSMTCIDSVIANPKPTWQSVFLNWLSREPNDRGKGGNSGGRPGDFVCLITPANKAQLWTTQPLLVWQGSYSVAGIRPKGNTSTLWEATEPMQTLAGKRSSYVGKQLVPGKQYEWGFFADQNLRSPLETVTFRVMGGKRRDEIAKGLQDLKTKLKTQKANREEIALQRTDYFVQRGLQADALQEIYSVKNPSPQLKQVIQEIEKKVCQPQK
jgi:hypothetical protein